MKELSIEEKAKAYDEALERAEKALEVLGTDKCEGARQILSLFHELCESENEKIRRALMKFIEKIPYERLENDGVSVKDALAWLEKQGKQKPTEKVEPKFKVKYAGSEYNVFETKDIAGVTFYGIEDEPNHIDYVKAENCEIISVYAIKENGSPYPTKPAVFSEQKPKRMISAQAKEALYDKPACAWSEEDEKMMNSFLHKVEVCNLLTNKENVWIINKLKSLKPQNTWKPSDEQMVVLELASKYERVFTPKQIDILIGLKEQLKKLKGE